MKIGNFLGRSAKAANVVVLSAALVISGCTVAPTAQELAETQDECSRYRTPFTKLSNERDARIQKYASAGAAVGGALGQNIAKNRGDSQLEGLVVGIIAGAVLGASAGYLADLNKRSSSTAGLQRAVNGDASRDLRETDKLVSAMTSLNKCRLAQIDKVERSVRAGGDKGTAKAEINRIQRKVDIDNRVIKAAVGDLTRTRNLYIGALKQSGADTENYVESIQQYKPKVSNAQQTSLQVSKSSRPKTSNAVAKLGYAEKELSAGASAHVQTIDKALDELNALLI